MVYHLKVDSEKLKMNKINLKDTTQIKQSNSYIKIKTRVIYCISCFSIDLIKCHDQSNL